MVALLNIKWGFMWVYTILYNHKLWGKDQLKNHMARMLEIPHFLGSIEKSHG